MFPEDHLGLDSEPGFFFRVRSKSVEKSTGSGLGPNCILDIGYKFINENVSGVTNL